MITGQECYFQSGIYIYWRGLELDAQMWANTGPICWTQITGSGQTDRQGMEWIKGDYKLPTAAVDKQRMLLRGVLHTSRTPTPNSIAPSPLILPFHLPLNFFELEHSFVWWWNKSKRDIRAICPPSPAHHLQVGCQSRNPAIFPSLHLAKSLCLGASGYLGQRRAYLEIGVNFWQISCVMLPDPLWWLFVNDCDAGVMMVVIIVMLMAMIVMLMIVMLLVMILTMMAMVIVMMVVMLFWWWIVAKVPLRLLLGDHCASPMNHQNVT